MKVWITRYALTLGIKEVEAELCDGMDSSMISLGNGEYCHTPDWYSSKEGARVRVLEMISSKLCSLEKQRKKLSKLAQVFSSEESK
jgi:hypothetical protein